MSMTAGQRWSKEKPTVPGTYKWRRFTKWKSFVVEVKRVGRHLEVWWEQERCAYLEDGVAGEFLGPITPNEEA